MKVIRIITKPEDIQIPKGGMKRDVKFSCGHATAAPQKQTTQSIFNHWKNHNKWKQVGYCFLISEDGTVEQMAELNEITNGVAGHNRDSIHWCYKGGVDASGRAIDNRTPAQIESMLMIVTRLKELFPNIITLGHRDFSRDQNGNGIIERWEWMKECPCFDVRDWIKSMVLEPMFRPSKIVYKLNDPLIKDNNVGIIQKALAHAGYPIKVDNYFGAETDKYIRLFQAKNKLGVDGIVGPNTQKALKINLI